MNYKKTIEYIQDISSYGIVPGLDNIKELCRRMGNPQDSLKFIHIAGTNGKGSVLSYVSSILKSAGYKVGRYLSPTILEYREKIQVKEKRITKAALCEGIELIKKHCEEMTQQGFSQPTLFEIETALAFWYFQKKECDIVVLETGMGGKNDATNIITTTQVAVIASVSMDHMKFLGNTIEKIAEQKAGILKKDCIAVSIKQAKEVMQVIKNAAEKMQVSLMIADFGEASNIRYGIEHQYFDYDRKKKLKISLAGKYQIDNAILAIETIKALSQKGFVISEKALREGLFYAKWLGRFSVIAKNPLFIIDGAHNEDAAAKLAESIEFYFTNKRIIYIMGILKDKEYEKIIALTQKYAEQIITITPPDNSRAMHAYDLAKEVAKVHSRVTAADSLEEAVEMAYLLAGKEDVIIAFGSLSYLGRLTELITNRP